MSSCRLWFQLGASLPFYFGFDVDVDSFCWLSSKNFFFFAELEVEICLKLVGFLSADYLSVFVRFELDVLACVSVL